MLLLTVIWALLRSLGSPHAHGNNPHFWETQNLCRFHKLDSNKCICEDAWIIYDCSVSVSLCVWGRGCQPGTECRTVSLFRAVFRSNMCCLIISTSQSDHSNSCLSVLSVCMLSVIQLTGSSGIITYWVVVMSDCSAAPRCSTNNTFLFFTKILH